MQEKPLESQLENLPQLPKRIPLNEAFELIQLNPSHRDEFFRQIDRHRDALSPFVHWTRFTHSPDDSAKFIAQCESEAAQGISFTWAICHQGKAVGALSFNKPIDWQARTAHIGYWLSPEQQGKGVVTQAVNAVIAATQTHFSRYVLRCAVHNLRSNAVAQRADFQFVGTQENGEQIGDCLYTQNIYHKAIDSLPS